MPASMALKHIQPMPRKQDEMKAAIQSVIKRMMESVMHDALVKKPFMPEKHRAENPLYHTLVPDEIFKGSHFEHTCVAPFSNAWEALAVIAAEKGLGVGKLHHGITGTVRHGRLRRIQEVLNNLEFAKEDQKVRPAWENELAYVLKGGGEPIPVTVICDVYAEDGANARKYAFELKAPMPNSDQTKVSKEKILKLYSMEPPQVDGAFYALPYNPYGRKEKYAWSPPARCFNMKEDEVVLIGNEFWDKVGGAGTYQSFIEAVNEMGREYKERIYREYLGIEPPADAEDTQL